MPQNVNIKTKKKINYVHWAQCSATVSVADSAIKHAKITL